MTELCLHDDTGFEAPPPRDVCETCIEIGGTWVHLRQCLHRGRTGCCDNSPNRHASGHARDADHPMLRTAEPAEDWRWCAADELFFVPGAEGYEIYRE